MLEKRQNKASKLMKKKEKDEVIKIQIFIHGQIKIQISKWLKHNNDSNYYLHKALVHQTYPSLNSGAIYH